MSSKPSNSPGFTRQDGVSLKEYVESRLDGVCQHFESRLEEIDRATQMATAALEKRLGAMNEFREALKDQAGRLATRDELMAQVDRLREERNMQLDRVHAELEDLKKFKATMEGKASQSSVIISYVLGAAALVFGVIDLILKFAK